MIPGSTRSFYNARRLLVVGVCALPLLAAGGAWWLISEVLLVPRLPGAAADGEECVGFMVHSKGLPRLPAERAEALILSQFQRAQTDKTFSTNFLSAMRRLAPEERDALRKNLFRAVKPRLLRDAYRFEALDKSERNGFLDDRIVEYAKLAFLLQSLRGEKGAFGEYRLPPAEALAFFETNTTEPEREAFMRYLRAYGERVQTALADPDLKRAFEERIGKPSDGRER